MMRIRTPIALGVIGAVGCLLLTMAARSIALRHIPGAEAMTTAPLIDVQHLRYQFRALGIVSPLAGFAAGWLAGIGLMRPLEQLRSDLGSGALSDATGGNAAASWNYDAHALRAAAQRHEAGLQRQMQMLHRDVRDLTQLVNTVSEGLVQIDSATRVVHANPAASRLLGLPPEIGGRALASLVRNVELRHVIASAAAGDVVDAVDVSVDDRRLLVSASPIPAENEHVRQTAVLAIADLTQLRKLESVRREFVANVSHELKTPLTSIHGYAETLRADEDLPPETRRHFLEVIERNAVRLQHIVDDLLDLSRIESGAWHPNLQEVDVTEIVNDAWSSCQEHASAGRIAFSTHEAVRTARVIADPDALRQVFSNLFENAIRYTPEAGRITVTIAKLHTQDVDDGNAGTSRIEIADTGIGIPRDALSRIFERFYRVDPARSRAAGGTGLGLAIVKHLVESMAGEVTAESEVGTGTTISVTLPNA